MKHFLLIVAAPFVCTLTTQAQTLDNVLKNGNTTTETIITSNAEGLKIANNNAFISGWNAQNTARTGYLQFNSSGNISLSAEGARSILLLTNQQPRVTITENGYVGIGTTRPAQKFVVSNNEQEGLEVYLENNGIVGLQAYNRQTSHYMPMYIDASHLAITYGSVSIGTPSPKSELTVNGTITTKKIKVTAENWPDYVFRKDYVLPSLQDVENFITTRQHLPGIPAAATVEKEGLELGEINQKLLQKIEELTLYLIDEHKKNKELEKQVSLLNERLTKLERP
ncbi:hypothetical protein [Chitinophaga flava]|uniref:BZIP transcription factor n=1 Tax=Chitinophaga flava TaxID=2259036 RepID=A0A365Y4U4_9BACT|nr:hypothetical protein [Chitinophaga flava]RBL93321.1 hypothetical protein DF182_12405 [Chitinophaga flava]